MADPKTDDDSSRDPYDGPFTEEDLFNVISNPNPSLMDLSLNDPIVDNQVVNTTSIHDATMEGSNVNDPLDQLDAIRDPPLPEFPFPNCEITEFHHGSCGDQTLSWTAMGQTSEDNVGNLDDGNNFGESNRLEESSWEMGIDELQCYEVGETSMALSVKPPEDVFVCNCCQPLRELIHSNGQEIMRLEIHGRIGLICHAILHIQANEPTSKEYRYQTFHFNNQSNEEVKEFLDQYCKERSEAGFVMVQDSLASFYQTMSIGLDVDQNNLDALDFNLQSFVASPSMAAFEATSGSASASASASASTAVKSEQKKSSKEQEKKKTPLAAQRERTGKLTLKDIGKYFHLPIEEAARMMKLCPTVVKKICRKGGLARWPHRKIKSIERKISTWKSVLRTTKNPEDRAHAEAEVEKLENEIQKIRSEALKDLD